MEPKGPENNLIGMNQNEELASQIKIVIFQHSEGSLSAISDVAIAQQLGRKIQLVAKITAELSLAAYIEPVSKGCWRWKYEPSDSPTVEVAV